MIPEPRMMGWYYLCAAGWVGPYPNRGLATDASHLFGLHGTVRFFGGPA